nr:thioredoxin [Bartonella tamiae]
MTGNVNLDALSLQSNETFIKETSTAQFQNDVIAESKKQPVLVDFWAPWCGPCKQLGPIIEKAVRNAKGAVKLVKMNIDDHPAIAGQMGIQSIPAVIAFVDGQAVDGFMGAKPESEVKAFIAKLAGNEKEEAIVAALEAANQMVESGDKTQAADLFARILQQAPETIGAIAGLADIMVETGESKQAQDLIATAPQDKADDPLLRAVEAKIALKELTIHLGDPEELKKQILQDPNNYQALYDLALIHQAHNERMEAADLLLSIIKKDRQWNDDGARKQLLQLFEAWGPMDTATIYARRTLSSLLFS